MEAKLFIKRPDGTWQELKKTHSCAFEVRETSSDGLRDFDVPIHIPALCDFTATITKWNDDPIGPLALPPNNSDPMDN